MYAQCMCDVWLMYGIHHYETAQVVHYESLRSLGSIDHARLIFGLRITRRCFSITLCIWMDHAGIVSGTYGICMNVAWTVHAQCIRTVS